MDLSFAVVVLLLIIAYLNVRHDMGIGGALLQDLSLVEKAIAALMSLVLSRLARSVASDVVCLLASAVALCFLVIQELDRQRN